MRDPLETILGYQLGRISAIGLKIFNQGLKPLGVRHLEASVLLVIEANPGVTQSAIAAFLHIQRANIAPIIGRLEKREWIVRSPGFGKTISLSVTPEGSTMIAPIRLASDASEDMLRAAMTLSGFEETLRRLMNIKDPRNSRV